MSNPLPKADVVIVGLGAAGGIAAHVLTDAGINVVGIEAGPNLGTKDFLANDDEISGSIRNWTGEAKYNYELPTWRPDAKSPTAAPLVPPVKMANMVGGSSIHYGTQSWRFLESDFMARTSTIDHYGEEALPQGATTVDWPVTSAEMEPYYDKVEYTIGVAGKGGANPFEAPRARDYPMPPARSMGYGEMVADAWTSLGYHPFPQPTVNATQEYDGRPACTYCGFCSPYGCWNDAKGSTLVTAIRKATATGKLEIRANSRVTKILTNDKGETTGVEYVDDQGATQTQPAGVVILSSYIYENVRLLFLSTSGAFKNGIGNNGGNLGKNYMSHAYVGNMGLFPGKRFSSWSGSNGQAVAMDDLNGDNFDHTGLGFVRGAVIFASNGNFPIGLSRNLSPDTPQWGAAYKKYVHDNSDSMGQIFAQVEPQPYESNFLDLDPEVKDRYGTPVLRVTYSLGENEVNAATYIGGKIDDMLKAAGATATWPSYPVGLPLPINSHAYGGARMGDDPQGSVVNRYSQVHESPNLLVLGGATFPGSSGYNPTQTIQALAWIAAENLAKSITTIAV